MIIINEDKYIPSQEKSKIHQNFISELQATYKLCLPFFMDSKTPETK